MSGIYLDTDEWGTFWIQILLSLALNGKGLTRVNLLKYSLINYARTKGRLRNHSGDSIAREREVSARFLTSYSLSLLSFFQPQLHTFSSQCPLFFRLLPRFSCLITCNSLLNVLHVKYIDQAVQFVHWKITSTHIS